MGEFVYDGLFYNIRVCILTIELAKFRKEVGALFNDLHLKVDIIGKAKEQARADPDDIKYHRSVIDEVLDNISLDLTNSADVKALNRAIKADKNFAVSLVRMTFTIFKIIIFKFSTYLKINYP